MSDTEESRTASLGRKRRAPQDVLSAGRAAAGKRQKLEQNEDFVSFNLDDDSDKDDQDEDSSEDSDDSDDSNDSAESGEISSSASLSQDGSKSAGGVKIHDNHTATREPSSKASKDMTGDRDKSQGQKRGDSASGAGQPARPQQRQNGPSRTQGSIDTQRDSVPASADQGKSLEDLDADDQALQHRYWRISDPKASIRCNSCSQKGHTPDSCPLLQCSACNTSSHSASQCPKRLKCTRCRRRGHEGKTCKRASVAAGGVGDECDICGGLGHAEEECSGLWSIYKPEPGNTRKISASQMRMGCYNCGRTDEWGDDCPDLPDFLRLKKGACRTWSRKYADMFIYEGDERREASSAGSRVDQGSLPAYQLAMTSDWR